MELITALAIGMCAAAGLFLMLRRNIIRAAMGLLLMGNAINLFLLSTGAYWGAEAAYTDLVIGRHSDALPQALILTAIVISFGGAAFVLGMVALMAARYRTCDADELKGLRR